MIFQGLQTPFGLHMWFGVSGLQNDFSKACKNHLASFCGASGPPNDFSKAPKNHLASFCGFGPQASKCFSKARKTCGLCCGRSLGRRASKKQGVLQTIICLIRRYMGLYKVIGICGYIRVRAGPAKDKA